MPAAGLNGTVDLIETIEPESYVTIVLQDPAARVKHADDYMAGAATERPVGLDTAAQRIQIRVQSRAAPALGQPVSLIADPGSSLARRGACDARRASVKAPLLVDSPRRGQRLLASDEGWRSARRRCAAWLATRNLNIAMHKEKQRCVRP